MLRNPIAKILILIAILCPSLVLAQIGASFALNLSPANPSSGETVTFSTSAYEFNMDLAEISWVVDGKVKEQGIGKKNFSIAAPANGKSMIVTARVTPQNGAVIEESITIAPSDMDIIWESLDGYTPPFYKGKTLPISQGTVKIAAIPVVKGTNGGYLKPSEFAYLWKKDGQNFQGQSGFNRGSFVFGNEILNKTNRVDVSATNGIKKLDGSVIVSYFAPEILFYEEYSLTGTQYQRSLNIVEETNKKGILLVAEPYFLSKNFKDNVDIDTDWTLNGQKAGSAKKNTLAINTSSTKGNVTVSFSYDDIRKLFRDFTGTINLNIK